MIFISLQSIFAFAYGGSEIEKDSSVSFIKRDSLFSFHSQKGFVPILVHNFGEEFLAPFKMKPKQMVMTATGVGMFAVLLNNDVKFNNEVREWKNNYSWINEVSPQVTELGGSYGIGFTGAFAAYGLLWKDRKAFHTSLLAMQAYVASGIWARVIKIFAERERPDVTYNSNGHGGVYFYGPFKQFDKKISDGRNFKYFDSFPSGHSATAFSLATVFAMQYSGNKFVPVISYTLATIASFSRMTENKHWASDVFAGACIGYLCGRQVVLHHRKLFADERIISSKEKSKAKFYFGLSQSTSGLSLTMVW